MSPRAFARLLIAAMPLLTSACAGLLQGNASRMSSPHLPYAGHSAYPIAPPTPSAMNMGYDLSSESMLAAMPTGAPTIRAASYLLIDANTGRHLAGRATETPRAVASTQKILTALVVLDAGNLDKRVTVQASDVRVEPTVLGLRPGDSYTRRHLLYAFLIKSCNDVANVLARDNAGSTAAFAAKMTAKARALGCTNSRFYNAHGLTIGGQHSTARDMARIAMAAYQQPVIRDAVRRKYYTFTRRDGHTVTLKNTNHLLGVMPECNGMKTGYTNASGRCLISTATHHGRNVILIQLGTKTRYIWDDARVLMSWGLNKASGGGLVSAQ
jgi:D-alanyl-D-alanine carboxypeptidase (penicillin-binding protein 5/6)